MLRLRQYAAPDSSSPILPLNTTAVIPRGMGQFYHSPTPRSGQP